MIGLFEMLLTASAVSGAAALALKLLPHAPPRVRFRIACAALAAWAMPWPLLSIPLEVPVPSALAGWRQALDAAAPSHIASAASARSSTERASTLPEAASLRIPSHEFGDVAAALPLGQQLINAVARGVQPIPAGYVLLLLFLPGLLRFMQDAIALRASLEEWRAASRSGEALRAGLPPELRTVRASIRVVRGSMIAASSGWLRPVVWLGDRLSDRDREVALVHELQHVRRKDPLWITFVTALRRAYWWNPVVAWLGREAVLAMEADCDRRSARWFGVEVYVERLASLMLDVVTPPAPRLLAHARTPNLNVRRLKLLETTVPRMQPRDYALIALMAALGVGSATYAVAKPITFREAAHTPSAEGRTLAERTWPDVTPAVDRSPYEGVQADWSRVSIPDTPAGDALRALLGAFNAGDSERLAVQLGAFTPQELEFDVPSSSNGLELVAIVASEPLRIEYVAEDRVGGTRRRGALEVAEWDTGRIAALEIRAASCAGPCRSGRSR